ncbi:MAG TPA: DNA mismatch repair protein MutS [Dehalococcoidia bacterium]|nr:DNA mismatch repair protein MutS [Dehalococcoidia bacterium]
MTTPLRRQYLEIKRRYPHAILFFRLGDFYETFDEDAEVAARELEITLTSRPVGKNQRVPLAGIPHHALDSYLAKLIGKGYKVAICEQMEAPGKGTKLVERQVVRVVTPGTLVEENLLTSGANNYLAAYVPADGLAAIAYVDVSTGEFACLQADRPAIAAECQRLAPAELLLPQGTAPPEGTAATLTPLAGERFEPEAAEALLLAHFGGESLDAMGLVGQSLATGATGAVLAYLQENQRAVLNHITRLSYRAAGGCMALDGNTVRNLELFQPGNPNGDGSSLLSVLDETKTAMGARLLRKWVGRPLLDIATIRRRQDGVHLFYDSAVRRGRVAALLANVPDVERLLGRVSTAAAGGPGPATPRDLAALGRGLAVIPGLREAIEYEPGSGDDRQATKEEMLVELHPCRESVDLIAAAIADDPSKGGHVIRAGFSEALDALRSVARDARQYLADLERRERERSGIKSLKVGYNRVFGYYIEVSKTNARGVPDNYQRKQTLVGGERYTTPELQEHEYKVLHAQEQQEEMERTLLRQVCVQVAAEGERILETAAAVAYVDVCCALAEVASRYGYTRPLVDESDEIVVRDGRHPVVERMLEAGTFVPNDTQLASGDAQVSLVTGPNMAGKSTYLRQVALIALMAQTGSFVPAAEARLGIVDRIFSRIGALDDIASGRSTFMVEMVETAAILHNATPRSLLIFDEIGRGTSTYDGMAIARAVVEFIHNRPDAAAKTLFATHYHELTELATFLPRVRNYNVAVTEEQGRVVFLHRILPGGADRSYGVHVAQLAGMPRSVVTRAREILEQLEATRGGTGVAQRRAESFAQLPLLARDDGLREELSALEMDGMTPLEAMTKLYELVERAKGDG